MIEYNITMSFMLSYNGSGTLLIANSLSNMV